MTSSILTSTGKWFDVLNPNPALIDIQDIAKALSKLCRFGGHCNPFYSVAEHSILATELMHQRNDDPTILQWTLLHDASETYVVDIPRPAKRQLSEYINIENSIQQAIAIRFKLPWPIPQEVHEVDDSMLSLELRTYMPAQPDSLLPPIPILTSPYTLPQQTLSPEEAEFKFLKMAKIIGIT